MKMNYFKLDFNDFKQALFLVESKKILTAMTDNGNFSKPEPALEVLTAAIGKYDGALSAGPGTANTLFKRQTRADLTTVLQKMGMYVQDASEDDIAKMATSGFTLRKIYSRIGLLGSPKNFRIDLSLHNCAKIKVDKIYGASTYNFEYTLADGSKELVWQACNSTKTFTTITKLPTGTQFMFRVAGVGAYPQLVYSNVLTGYIQ